MRKQFQSQLAELENLPEILKMKETLLADCQDQLQNYEKKNMDLSAQVADLRQRVRNWQEEHAAQQSPGCETEISFEAQEGSNFTSAVISFCKD